MAGFCDTGRRGIRTLLKSVHKKIQGSSHNFFKRHPQTLLIQHNSSVLSLFMSQTINILHYLLACLLRHVSVTIVLCILFIASSRLFYVRAGIPAPRLPHPQDDDIILTHVHTDIETQYHSISLPTSGSG